MPLFTEKKKVVGLVDPETKEPIEISEEKPYLVILRDIGDEDTNTDYSGEVATGRWIATRGRESVFDYLQSELYNIDPVHSYIFSGSIGLGGEVSVYSFMRLCIQNNKVPINGDISVDDIDDYIKNNLGMNIDLNLLYNNEVNKSV